MHISVVTSRCDSPAAAYDDLNNSLAAQVSGLQAPDFITFQGTSSIMTRDFHARAQRRFRPDALHGGTSSEGVISPRNAGEAGFSTSGALAIYDPEGNYGTGSAVLGSDPFAAAALATERALLAAGRRGEAPDMIFLTVAPGTEEAVLRGIRSVVGAGTPIMGGSSADEGFRGAWAQFCGTSFHTAGVVVSALFPSVPPNTTLQTAYAPTGDKGIVTAAGTRRIFTIDGQPAAEVYERWSRGAIRPVAPGEAGRKIMRESTLWPFGRVSQHLGTVPFHLLLQPTFVHPDGSVDMLADVHEGDELWQMYASLDHLVAKTGRAARHLRQPLNKPVGGIVVYCAGCMMMVRDRMPEVVTEINQALDGAPFLGLFSYGEQGAVSNGFAEHGNLMVGFTLFG